MRLLCRRDGRRYRFVLTVLLIGFVVAGCQVAGAGSLSREVGSTETRLVTHAMGESRVPVAPQRVVVLETGELDDALALGVKPMGAVLALAGQPMASV